MIIPIFLMNRGCPNRCVYCNETISAGDDPGGMDAETLRKRVETFLAAQKGSAPCEIAFYGGNFAGLAQDEQERLLAWAGDYQAQGLVDSIRISTRPDSITPEGLDFLAARGVRTVEMGIQSFVDEVLEVSQRGHRARDGEAALRMVKARGFRTGVHLMAGLPGDSPEGFALTLRKTVALEPHTVRVHPTLVFRDTPLAAAFRRGDYRPLGLTEAVALCKEAVRVFRGAGIDVIRLGLQPTPAMEAPGAVVAGPYHPAFGALVYEALFLDMASSLMGAAHVRGEAVHFQMSHRDISPFHGQAGRNIRHLEGRFRPGGITWAADRTLERGTLLMTAAGRVLCTGGYMPLPPSEPLPSAALNAIQDPSGGTPHV